MGIGPGMVEAAMSQDWSFAAMVIIVVALGVISEYFSATYSQRCAQNGGVWVQGTGCHNDYCTKETK